MPNDNGAILLHSLNNYETVDIPFCRDEVVEAVGDVMARILV